MLTNDHRQSRRALQDDFGMRISLYVRLWRQVMTHILDTNAILRYLLNDNPGQFKIIKELMEEVRIGSERAVILESILAD